MAPIEGFPVDPNDKPERDRELVRGLLQALAAYTFATPWLIARSLTGILWTQKEVEQLYPENAEVEARRE